MEPSRNPVVKAQREKRELKEDQSVQAIEWEDYEQELARLCSLTSALEENKKKKLVLEEKLNSWIQIEAESLSRSNELDKMCEKLEYRKLVMGNMLVHSKVVKDKARKQEEQLSTEIRSLLAGGSSLSEANKSLQDSSRSLGGEKGYNHMKNLQKLLRIRQQLMILQVSLLYPVKIVIRKASEQDLESFGSDTKSGIPDGSKLLDHGALTISGLHLTVIPLTTMSFFTDKKEVQRTSTALGYVAHAVSLIAPYMQVPLRYPLRLGGSRSYIRDYSPSVENSAAIPTSDSIDSTGTKLVEFPLFIEGQDSTRAAYAVFLLNKDVEQLLNFIGGKSLGPRHVLANLRELYKMVLSPEYVDL